MPALKRILRMPPRELAYRLTEKARTEMERRKLANLPAAAPARFKKHLVENAAARFYQRPSRELFHRNFPHWIARATDEAECLCRHEFQLLGFRRTTLDREIDWHRDPITGQKWELRFWADYRPEADPRGRDSKRIHELNRHQHLPRLAKAFYLTGDERYAAEAVAQMKSWIDQNPRGIGINWQSSLEIALRTISWLWTIFLITDSESLGEGVAQQIGDALFAQLDHVHRHTSRFSSPNTHLLGEATALFIAGLTFLDVEPAPAWLRHGTEILTEEAEKQILNDGVHAELSSYYHCYTLDFYLQAFVLAERNHYSFPPSVRERIAGMLRFLRFLTRPDGTIPLLGDDDGGRAVALERKSYRSFADALTIGKALFGEAVSYSGENPEEEAVWLLGGLDGLKPQPQADDPKTTHVFEDAGYVIQRSGWGALDDYLTFDCGGLGMLRGGHAHADALSITLFSRGRDLLVDPGTFVYNCAPRWREYFRSTRAHNTVAIDGWNQADTAGTFRWRKAWKSELRCRMEEEWVEYIEAQHDGYKEALAVVHRRRLLYVRGEYWVIADEFPGSGKHAFNFSFHLGPEVDLFRVAHRGRGFLASEREGLLLGMHASGSVATEVVSGETVLIGGWISNGYGEKQPSVTIRARLTADAPAAALTFVAAAQTGATFEPLLAENAIACSFRNGPFEDIAVFSSGSGPIKLGPFCLEGEFFWFRLQHDELRRVAAVRAKSASMGGTTIFNNKTPGPYFSTQEEKVCAPFAAF